MKIKVNPNSNKIQFFKVPTNVCNVLPAKESVASMPFETVLDVQFETSIKKNKTVLGVLVNPSCVPINSDERRWVRLTPAKYADNQNYIKAYGFISIVDN